MILGWDMDALSFASPKNLSKFTTKKIVKKMQECLRRRHRGFPCRVSTVCAFGVVLGLLIILKDIARQNNWFTLLRNPWLERKRSAGFCLRASFKAGMRNPSLGQGAAMAAIFGRYLRMCARFRISQ